MIKIYFSAAISAGRELQPLYARMVEFITSCGAEVLSAHVAAADVLHAESQLSAREIFARDMQMISVGDGMIAEVSKPSLGVGFEIATCLQLQQPVLCLCEKEVFLTRMLTGNNDQHLTISFYEHDFAWQAAIANFCRQLSRKDRLDP